MERNTSYILFHACKYTLLRESSGLEGGAVGGAAGAEGVVLADRKNVCMG